MIFKHFLSKEAVNYVSRFSGRRSPCCYRSVSNFSTSIWAHHPSPYTRSESAMVKNFICPNSFPLLDRFIHSVQETVGNGFRDDIKSGCSDSEEEEEDAIMNEFLSRFVWIMRGKLSEVYTECSKKDIDGMLLIIVAKVVSEMEKGGFEQVIGSSVDTPSPEFSEDLWKTVWEVSNVVLEDMKKAKKKEKMKAFLQSEDVKEMCRFAGEVGIRGDMLRELRFKWAREKLEESEFYQQLEHIREENQSKEVKKDGSKPMNQEPFEIDSANGEDDAYVVSLPKRSGKIKYKIYGLDLSNSKWAEVAEKIYETGNVVWPEEPKQISGKCRIVTEKILSLHDYNTLPQLLKEWIELLQPSRIDWIALLEKLDEHNRPLYFKVAEHALEEESFQTSARDYSKLVDAHAKENHLDDAERILKKMSEKGIDPDILTFTTMVHMYSKAGNLDRAKKAFTSLTRQGFEPDVKVFNSMIMAYVNGGQPSMAEELLRVMDTKNMKPTEEIYMATLRAFAQHPVLNEIKGANKIANSMDFAGFLPSVERSALLVEANGRSGDIDEARKHFNDIYKLGEKPDDRCIANMIAAYGKNNLLDKGVNLLLQLEKEGVELGVATYSVLVDWMAKLLLIDEAEELLGKIAERSDSPPLQVHISLCDMYARAGAEKKAIQALGILESKKDQLKPLEFDRIIHALIRGGFVQDARRIHDLMETQGFAASDQVKVALGSAEALRTRPSIR